MSEITRRSFLKQGGATAAAAGALVATPKILRAPSAGARHKSPTTTTAAERPDATRDLVVHVPDTRKDEVRLLVADREVVLHDRELVARLSRSAR